MLELHLLTNLLSALLKFRKSLKDILKVLGFYISVMAVKFKLKAICAKTGNAFSWFILCVMVCTDVSNKTQPSAACLCIIPLTLQAVVTGSREGQRTRMLRTSELNL